MKYKLLLFDLDGTLLQTDKTISKQTMQELENCRKQRIISELNPEIVISSAGALVKYKDEYIYKAEFSAEETSKLIKVARQLCGGDCEITIDTVDGHYWNYKDLMTRWQRSYKKIFRSVIVCAFRMDIGINSRRKPQRKKMLYFICANGVI